MEEKKHRTTLYLDKHVMKEVKMWAVQESRSVSQIVERLLTEYLLTKKAGFDDPDEDPGDGSQTIADVESIFGTPSSKEIPHRRWSGTHRPDLHPGRQNQPSW